MMKDIFYFISFLPPTKFSNSDSHKPKDEKLWPKIIGL